MDTHEYEESCNLKSHRKLNSHESIQRVTRGKHIVLLGARSGSNVPLLGLVMYNVNMCLGNFA